jgi:hypothetical protein
METVTPTRLTQRSAPAKLQIRVTRRRPSKAILADVFGKSVLMFYSF